jgi:Trm5-related predicted tRNA methylase
VRKKYEIRKEKKTWKQIFLLGGIIDEGWPREAGDGQTG